MNGLSVDYVPVDSVTPYINNARLHTEYDLSAIRSSIEQFGFNDPVGVWGKDNIVVEGHGRLEVAIEMGMQTIPVIHLDHLSDNERRAYALAHNKTAELSSWNYATLEEELRELFMFDMKTIGFTETQENIDGFDDLFKKDMEEKEKPKKKIYCPHCGEWFEV